MERFWLGRLDASKGEFFKCNGNGLFQSISYSKSGLKSEGEIRDIVVINIGGKPHLIFVKNNAPIDVCELKWILFGVLGEHISRTDKDFIKKYVKSLITIRIVWRHILGMVL